jgi:HrpA-like RNA helicase
MSATIDSAVLCNYFNCKAIEIPGFTYPVTDIYLEKILADTGYRPGNLNVKLGKTSAESEEYSEDDFEIDSLDTNTTNRLLRLERHRNFKIDLGLISATVKHICQKQEEGAILIFLPGIMEIKTCISRIKEDLKSANAGDFEIFPLHSNLTSKEQSAVFRKMPPGKRKIVVSTNIAETSVTIDDVVFVIDTGRVKEMGLVNSVLSLTETWASSAACKQRRGRAGRVRPGFAYKLFTSKFAKRHMQSFTKPEILRLPLEKLCLQIKYMGIDKVEEFLGKV